MSPHSYIEITGEATAAQLKDAGVDMVIIGQAERRTVCFEDEIHTLKKVREALDNDL